MIQSTLNTDAHGQALLMYCIFMRHFIMPFPIERDGCSPATSSDSRINPIAHVDTPPEMSAWEKIEAFFPPMDRPEAQACMQNIYYPPAGTTREDVAHRFEQLRTFAYSGYRENIQSGRHGENHFCILDATSREMLSVTLDDANRYTFACEGHEEVYHLAMVTQRGAECAEHTEGESGDFRATHAAATTAPQTAEDYEAAWSAWLRAAPPEEEEDRAIVVQRLRECQDRNDSSLNLNGLIVSSLPDLLPNFLTEIKICANPLYSPMPLCRRCRKV